MFSFVFNFEINLKDALETPALIAILVFVVIFAVKQRHRRRTRLFMDKRLNTSACCSKPIPVENEEKSGNVSVNLKSYAARFFSSEKVHILTKSLQESCEASIKNSKSVQ